MLAPPNNRLVMAFDFGMKKIGIAVGQSITKTANPLTVISARDGIPDWHQVKKLIEEWQPTHLVVGLPLNMDDTASEMSLLAEKFARKLSGRFNVPHSVVDERLSSFEARQTVQESPRSDSSGKARPYDDVAAQLILETYFRGI